ncbi:hypothetical protein D3C73_1386690 [compost metagenome]
MEKKEIDISEKIQNMVRENVRDAVIGIRGGDFKRNPKDISRCGRCDLKLVCPGVKSS